MGDRSRRDERQAGEERDRSMETTPEPADAATDEQPVCAICGHPIERDSLVCPHCGTRLVAG